MKRFYIFAGVTYVLTIIYLFFYYFNTPKGIGFLHILCALAIFALYIYKIRALIYIADKQKERLIDHESILAKLSVEKDWLEKEIHHRVKNNLQIVSSLLNTQSAYISSPEVVTALNNSRHRLYAISLVHQKLYQTDNLSTIDLPLYIHDLVAYLKDEYQIQNEIIFELQAQPLQLEVTAAVPLGLIINEAVSNILKFAFPDALGGKVQIQLQIENQKIFKLRISDNGVGLPLLYDITKEQTFGTSLMNGLSQQLKADLEIKNDHGVSVIVHFSERKQVA